MSTASSPPQLLQQDNPEAPPPPDYHSSIITPPAYITGQQPRKVPSYRSLEHLFARQNGSLTREHQGDETSPEASQQDDDQGEQGSGQVVVVMEEQQQHHDLPDPIDSAGTDLHTTTVVLVDDDQEPLSGTSSSSSPMGVHSTIEIRNTLEMSEMGSGFGPHAFRLCSGLVDSSLDVEAGPSNSSSRIETRPDVFKDDSSSDTEEEERPKQTKDKGKAPCRE